MMNRENKIETVLFTKITQAPDGKISFADYMDWVLLLPITVITRLKT